MLILLMTLVPSEISASAAVGVLGMVAVSSAVSLKLVEDDEQRAGRLDSKHPLFAAPNPVWFGIFHLNQMRPSGTLWWPNSLLTIVSIAIPLVWALLLEFRSPSRGIPVLAVAAVLPVAIVWLTSRFQKKSQSDNSHLSPTRFEFSETDEAEDDCDEELLGSPNVTQWLKRSLNLDGELMEGGVRVDFSEGQREATVHVSFCPPFQGIPVLTTEDLDGADLEIKVSAIYVFGARLNIRRPIDSVRRGIPISAARFRIGFVAVASTVRRAA